LIKIVMGTKGSGKTKKLIEAVEKAIKEENGNIVCIEKDDHLRYDISRHARLLSTDEYGINDFDKFYGFITGLAAGNYDITAIFIDSILKICRSDDLAELENFIDKVQGLNLNIKLFITVSMDASLATDKIKPYII